MWQATADHLPAIGGAIWAVALFAIYRLLWRTPAPLTVTAGAALVAASGGAHLALVPSHLEDGSLGALFAVDGLALLTLAAACFTRLPWRPPAALLLTATVLAYLANLVAGPEGPDQVGLAAKLVEIAALGLLLVPVGQVRLGWLRWVVVVTGVPGLVLMTGLVSWGVTLARPDAHHNHVGAVIQGTDEAPTPEQVAAAERLLVQTSAAIQRFKDPGVALAAGYRPGNTFGPQHWMNPAYLKRRNPLDPAHPAGLVYVPGREGLVLVGAMFEAGKPGQFPPSPGGPLTAWHQHEHICVSPFGGGQIALETPLAACPLGSVSITFPPMLHVWIVPNPGGPFAVDLDRSVIRAIESR